MTTGTQLQPAGKPKKSKFVVLLWCLVGYWILSCLTMPFAGSIWLGELPVVAVIQVPKIVVADWIRIHVVMEWIDIFGVSRGSFSPDYILARPYALALYYLLVVTILVPISFCSRLRYRDQRLVIGAFVVAVAADYFFTLGFGNARGLSFYG